MKSFETIAAERPFIPVKTDVEPILHGVLNLDGKKTFIDLVGSEFFHFETDEKRCCDLQLLGSDGVFMTAHNAVFLGTGASGGGGCQRMHHTRIYPSVLIMDSRGHSDEGKISQIDFQLRGLKSFFRYDFTELVHSFQLNSDIINSIDGIRDIPNRFDDINLSHIYLCHAPRSILQFNIGDRTYCIEVAIRHSGYNNDSIDLDIIYIAKIKFKNHITLDEALGRVHEWRQFFNQIMMTPLPVDAMAVAAEINDAPIFSDLYIPYFVNSDDPEKAEYRRPPTSPPFNRWHEREILSDYMKKWLELAPKRKAFRERLDGVIEHLHSGIQQSDIVELCAGIDSLVELDQKDEFPEGLLESMANAAFGVVEQPINGLDAGRIKGLLGGLQKRSLLKKMEGLSAKAVPDVYAPQREKIVRLAIKLRTAAAHRGAIGDQHDGCLRPVVSALASLCVAFELSSCGVAFDQGNDSGTPRWKHRFFEAAMELDRLKK
jgi:ApeA N-terminal domain 1